jgi:hypothetical protein
VLADMGGGAARRLRVAAGSQYWGGLADSTMCHNAMCGSRGRSTGGCVYPP